MCSDVRAVPKVATVIDPAGDYFQQVLIMGVTAIVVAAISDGMYADPDRRCRPADHAAAGEVALARERRRADRRRRLAGADQDAVTRQRHLLRSSSSNSRVG